MQQPDQRRAGIEQLGGAGDLEGHQPAQRRCGGRAVQLCLGHAECGEIFLREVHPTGPTVLSDVLPVLDQLQGGADPVGQLCRHRIPHLEQAEHDPADRVRGQRAIPAQLRVCGIPVHSLVDQVGLDQPLERLPIQPTRRYHRGQSPQHRVLGLAAVPDRGKVAPERSQLCRPVPRGLISQIIDYPGDVIHHDQSRPQSPR